MLLCSGRRRWELIMKDYELFVQQIIEDKAQDLQMLSDFIWDHPETLYEEYDSSAEICNYLEQQGFDIEQGIANIPTAFSATFGNKGPVIGLLAEYDALPSLSQVANITYNKPVEHNKAGHGCGHNLLGTGAIGAALAVQAYLEKYKLPGTVKIIGCPAEEGGSGKGFLARAGMFDDLDLALTWHPTPFNAIMALRSLANFQVKYKFKGKSAHAASAPHIGRSALDAVELMNVGGNYLREHLIQDARIHYAITDTGGVSPNVVQAEAEVVYLIRAPKIEDAREIYKRVDKIAQGAALMTGTTMSSELMSAVSEYVPNQTLEQVVFDELDKERQISYTSEEQTFAQALWETLSEEEQQTAVKTYESFGVLQDQHLVEGKNLSDVIHPYEPTTKIMYGSTDVADVSWNVPTAQVTTATAAIGTQLHTWQMVAQGKSTVAQKGMSRAARVLARSAIYVLEHPEKLKDIEQEFDREIGRDQYQSPLPEEVKPPVHNME